MGTELSDCVPASTIRVIPWLDSRTGALVGAIVATVASQHPALVAAIMFGSVARHEERPLGTLTTSDVDLLFLFETPPGCSDLPFELHRAIFASVGRARERTTTAPRDVRILAAASDLADWDESFVANVARDGLLLWARGPLPPALAVIATRA